MMYVYNAELVRVIDGDTIVVVVDLGFSIGSERVLRLYGVDCPERGTPEGKAATAFTRAWLNENPHLIVRTVRDKTEKYGRYLAVVVGMAERTLSEELIAAGHAKSYDGGKR